ncbi:Mitochondrial fission process protein 1 [Trichostrongylus colubriformis]|uniref:Mitochondrial fission process protein 1 n=1 Tax=Trichostrongylus colubriformis TaxID=6319 RepID=A0AAN8FCA5_TRICO
MSSLKQCDDDLEVLASELRQIDLYRDTPIRYLGYANEIGEAFRSMFPLTAVRATYVVALSYACADAFDKSNKAYKAYKNNPQERRKQVAIAAGDTFLWQALASVAIPGFTINRICHFSAAILRRVSRWSPPAQKWIVTAIGLSAIPFIIHPIDAAVEVGMDRTVRQLYTEKERQLYDEENRERD